MTTQMTASSNFTLGSNNREIIDEESREYYATRAARARTLAEKAVSPAIRNIHLQMAQSYEGMCGDGGVTSRPRQSISI